MKILGIDLGSREVKLAVMDKGRIVERKRISTAHFYRNYCRYDQGIVVDLPKLGYAQEDFDLCVSTGYGRNNIDLAHFTPITEIRAHVHGAAFQMSARSFVLLDLGGQDVKVIRVEDGMIRDLDLNDKCAASCGRYLENMSRVLEVELDELGLYHSEPVPLNSTCAVFSESELIGRIAEGISIERLCAGVNNSMVQRMLPMLIPFTGHRLLVSGGASLNRAVIHLLAQQLGQVEVLSDPQHNGAIGCCVYGEKQLLAEYTP